MDQKRQRTISDIRPARSMDGVTPSGGRQMVASKPAAGSSQPEPVAASGNQKPAATSAAAVEEVAPRPDTVRPTANATVGKTKTRRGLKIFFKTLFALVVAALLAAGGWFIYGNYFR